MPPPRPDAARAEAADALGRVAPLVTRCIERLLAAGDPPLTPAQHQALAAVADGVGTSAELARRTGVSAAAVSQLLGALEAAALVRRAPGDDRRRRRDPARAAGRGPGRPAGPGGRRAGALAGAGAVRPGGHPAAAAAAATTAAGPAAPPSAALGELTT